MPERVSVALPHRDGAALRDADAELKPVGLLDSSGDADDDGLCDADGDAEPPVVTLCDDVRDADAHCEPLALGSADGDVLLDGDALLDGDSVAESLAVDASPAPSSCGPGLDVGRCVPSIEKNADFDGRREPDGVREAPPEPDGEGERLADVVTDGDGVDDDDAHDVPHGDGVAVSDGDDEAQGLDERDGDAAPEVEAPGDDVDVPHCDADALT